MNTQDALLFLSYLNFDYNVIEKLINYFSMDNLSEIFKIKEDSLYNLNLLTKKSFEKFIDVKKRFDANLYREYLENKKIKFVSILDDDYPKNLKEIEYAPKILYYKGTLCKSDEFAISIVGSRKCSTYGAWACEKFEKELSEKKITIISGMALGIDSISHKTALKNNTRTIAVLGSGVDEIYPKTNTRLYHEIIENGCVLSEFPPKTPALSFNFPIRNRIISGLSKALLVVEAKEKSGTLITARFANEQSKEIFAVPGNINSIYSKGTNKLIKDGALIATQADDIILSIPSFVDFINEKTKEKKDTSNLTPTETLVYTLIEENAKNANKISEILGLSIIETNTILTSLELKGFITELSGGIFTVE